MANFDEIFGEQWKRSVEKICGASESSSLGFSQAWEIATSALKPRPLNEHPPPRDQALVLAAVQRIHKAKMTPFLIDSFLGDLRKCEHFIESEINESMGRYDASQDPNEVAQLIDRLAQWYKHWVPNPNSQSLYKTFQLAFQTHLFSFLPLSFPDAFKALLVETIGQPVESNVIVFQRFEVLGFLDRYESLLASVVYQQIELRVAETCPKEWTSRKLADLRTWLKEKIVPWLAAPYARGARTVEDARAMVSGIISRFDFHVCRTLCDLRIKEIFDIIVDYPDSMDALIDLKECLTRVDQRPQLVTALRKANHKRLLHPGADTKDILSQYVSTIKCLRIVDPPGVLLYKVADPIRRYLRERPDTIRSIVSSLVGEGGDLIDESEQPGPVQTVAEDFSDPNWEPEPIDAGPEFRTSRPSDVITTLVSIYDSKDLFVKELQVLLAQRLLAITDGNFEKERRNIEILKLRFGEAALQVCEVMLKDMTDSKRIDHHIQAQGQSIMHPTVISRHFWPPLQGSRLRMPGQFREIQENYGRGFSAFKPDKRLRWLPHLGEVHLDVELSDRTVSVEVSPLEAAIIELFSSKPVWSMDEISVKLGQLDHVTVQKGLLTWIEHGVVSDQGDNTFRLLEQASTSDVRPAARPMDIIEDTSPVVTTEQQQADQMRIYWQFIQGMLTNIGPMPIERIQGMLRLAPGYDRTVEQLGGFLEAARREGLVLFMGGMWQLNR
ncbi:hypothetical protein SISNIDRAFT_474501 [Sistotremastrum niveocremeum HHB9708]|uniref:Anaphase-promoting complex subunit 2 n=2 Tax=Sistotremastraceae TaxID=3402574 RepID=A0A164U406_9AGAM|nr:hypothetical protein SISNIDRAFT_474501 [Sistotremastrum niveocremeum HHB9708]KZT44431.1 hypothetical protein SISSUDRAFT_1056784 [Sistotremastrum suecicum HHB10207 ss-3]